MQYAIVDGRRAEAFAGGHGTCETCGSTMVAKCGPRVLHHWAHASRRNCDPWWENETPWHRAWKNLFPEDCREICHVAPDGEIHRVDIKTSTGIVIEVQHSAMTNAERLSREDFYGNLVWVLDGSAFRDNFQVHHILPDPTSELAKDLVWLRAGVGLHRANRGIFLRLSECQQDDPTVTKATAYGGCMRSLREIEKEVANAYRGHHQYVWVRPRRTWLEATCPVYIDFGEDWLARLETYDESGIPCLLRVAKRKFLHDAMFETNARAIATRYYPINGPPRALGRNETASAMTETPPARLEHEIFADLQALCTQPGFIHVLAYLCFRDNMVLYSEDVTVEHLREVFGPDRLIRTEITTLLGLMIKAPIDWTLPPRELQQQYLEASEHLLLELHHALNAALNLSEAAAAIERGEEFNPFEAGPAMREPMFYAAESAYDFQYLDLASLRYAADADWLQQHRGFTIEQASRVAEAANRLYQGRFDALREQMREAPPDQWTMLPGFSFTAAEVAAQAELDDGLVEHILDAFTLPADEVNTGFATVHDFNAVTATPLLRRPNGEYVSLQNYALAQAIYDSPFHWMLTDKAYRATQDKHRGDFTESFVAERLATVFGADRVLLNVDIWEGKGKKVGEIDVLVLWADRAIIVQAKSKKLTIEARKGNDQVIRDDFQKSVQDAYDQGLLCAECLGDPQFRVTRTNGAEVELDGSITEIFVFCVVSDHYPALNFQARQFLKTREVARVRSALVTDVFLIDALTELLNSPLRFLSYVSRRARYGDRLLASQEMAILGYHLKHNLWFDDEKALVTLDNEFALPIDLAMAVRRRGLAGAATPEGLLTRYEGTTIGRLLDEMAAHAQPAVLDQGFQLLEMDGETLDSLNRMIDGQAKRAARDGQPHNIALVFPDRSGFTVLISAEPDEVAMRNLALLAARRKYLQKADLWFGLCLTPGDAQLRFGLRLAWPWEQNDELDAAAAKEVLPKPMPHRDAVGRVFRGGRTTPRVGRNDPCPCGSGRKWKKCCGA